MTAINSYEINNEKRDLSDILSTLIVKKPNFINWFSAGDKTVSTKHEWLEDVLRPLRASYSSATNVGVFTLESTNGWQTGDLVRIDGDPAVLKITGTTTTTITTSFVAANGSSLTSSTIPTGAGVLVFDSHPISQGSSSGPETFRQSSIEYNTTQIFRKDVTLTGTALASVVYGKENSIDKQIENAMYDIQGQINHSALFGVRSLAASGVVGQAGGLYYFGTQTGGLSVDASTNALELDMIQDAARSIQENGGDPNIVLCSPKMAQVISRLNHGRMYFSREDKTLGNNISQIMCEVNGKTLAVVVEPEMIEKDVWVIDTSGLYYAPMQGRELWDEDTTTKGVDGQRRSLLGELTFVFKNSKQKLCRIKNCESPATTLTKDLDVLKVKVTNSSDIGQPTQLIEPVLTATKKDNDEVTLTWANNSNATRFEVRYATSEAGLAEATISTIAHNAAGTVVGSLTANTTYYFQIRAVGDGTNYTSSDWSASASAKTDAS